MDEIISDRLTCDNYPVGWICALDVELAASVAMLDHEFPSLPQASGDSNTYTLGRIGQHKVVLTCLPAGTTGTNAAAYTATNMLRSFPKIRFCFMVGIGGGAPSVANDDPYSDIRLGDVAVSCPSANSGGVLQYDFGKTMSEGNFMQTGALNKTSIVLSNSVSTLRARHRIEGSRIPQYISQMLESKTRMHRQFSHPGLEHDQLFRADYEHATAEPTCHSCCTEALVLRKFRENLNPVIHYGLIGSANQVMKHGATRDKLRDEKNIICFEMEAAGLMDVFPCLVVRGICDYADSHKNKRWQPYAAAVAAACAKEILSFTPAAEAAVKSSFNGETIYRMLQATLYDFNLNRLLNVLLSASTQRRYHSLATFIDYDDPNFHWVLKNMDFKQWSLEGGPTALCLTAVVPENGLCQLSSYIVDQKKAAGYSILPIFCSSMVDKPSMKALLHLFLLELVYCSPEAERTLIIRGFFNKLLEKPIARGYFDWKEKEFTEEIFLKYMRITLEDATTHDLLTSLKVALDFERQKRLLVVIDGLDVIDSADELVGYILPLVKHLQQQKPNARILLTSSARSKTIKLFQEFLHIEFDKERKECLQTLQLDDSRYDKIAQEYEGSFEWIWTHHEYERWSAPNASRLLYIQGKPGSGKSTLAKFFNHYLLQRQPASREAIVAKFFYSSREGNLQRSHHSMLSSILYDILQQEEAFFYHQCQVEYRANQRYESRFRWDYDSLKRILKSLQDYRTNKQFYLTIDAVDESDEKDRREILGLLLELCSKMKHSCVKVFMASRPVAQLEARRDQFHNFIKLDDETRSDICHYAQSQRYGLDSTDLLARATTYILENAAGVFLWVKLISERLIEAHEDGCSEEEIFDLLKQLPTELEDFYELMLKKMKQNNLSLLYGSKLFRFILFARRSITVDEVLHALGILASVESEPMFVPSDDSFERRISSSERIILSIGGNFLEIKEHNDKKMVQIMHQTVRDFFLNPNGPIAKSEFSVSETHAHACIAITCVRYLSVCAESTSLSELPIIRSWNEAHYQSYCRYLNGRPLASYALNYVKPHIDRCKSEDDVEYAASRFIEHLTHDPGASLLERWANSELYYGSFSRSSTQDAIAMNFRDEVLRITSIHGWSIAAEVALLAKTDMDNKDEHGRTPLSLAASNGHDSIVRLLLEHGASIDQTDGNNRTPLSWAAEYNQLAIVKLLVEKGANVEHKERFGKTPLLWAAKHDHLAIVQFLVESGANIENGDRFEKTPLLWAAEHNHLSILEFLMGKGANIETRDSFGKTPLVKAAERGNLAIAELLVEQGAYTEIGDYFKKTPLLWAAEQNHSSVTKFLIQKGANVEARDYLGQTPLSKAVENGHLAIVKILVNNGADIRKRDGLGNKPLYYANEKGHWAIFQFLVEKGAKARNLENFGRPRPPSWDLRDWTEEVMRNLSRR